MATYNGDRWLQEQLDSVTAQEGVSVSIVASDDASTDRTPSLLEAESRRGTLTILPPSPTRFGNANRNFMRLIRDVAVDEIEYFAFSDQDDIWLPDKLRRAVDVLSETGSDGYSSDVTAFWPDGRRKRLGKARPKRAFDHLFESGGPGCTFVLRRSAFVKLQAWVLANFDALQTVKVHDWLIYSYAREQGWKWTIDDRSTLLYRQHERNEAGANVGWNAARSRLAELLGGQYRRDVLAIGAATGSRAGPLTRLARLRPADRLYLAFHVGQYRRALRDRLVLAAAFLAVSR